MLADTYNAGSSWLPLKAGNDSYAMVTGARYRSIKSFGLNSAIKTSPTDKLYPLTLPHFAVLVASGGLGMELARLLYKEGFSLVLVARDVGSLQDLKDSLETEATITTATTEALQGRLGPRADQGSSSEREGEDGREGENRDDNQGNSGSDEDYEDDNALEIR